MPQILRRRSASLTPAKPLLLAVSSYLLLREGVPRTVALNAGAVAKVAIDVLCL